MEKYISGLLMLPGAYDFARAAWFMGLAATGSTIGDVELIEAALGRFRRRLRTHRRNDAAKAGMRPDNGRFRMTHQ